MKRRRRIKRKGFTLMEMLIVIAIILLLAAMTIPLVGNVTNQARRAATKTTIKKAHELLAARVEAFERDYKVYFRRSQGTTYDPGNKAHIIQRKRDFQQRFPMYLGSANASAADNSEALLHMLTKMEILGGTNAEATNFNEGEINDTDDDGVNELVDGWGRPIRFYRWPTRLVRNTSAARILIKNLPADVNKDGDDPYGRLVQTDIPEATFHTVNTYHPPLLVSAGSDGELGLYEPYEISNLGHLALPKPGEETFLEDNITNLNNQTGND